MNVVVVESPGKVRAINKYLGSDYKVLASYGHVRDLPSKDGSVRPDEDFAMSWDVDPKAAKRLNDIAAAMKGADRLILATDPDREGEAISWHVLEVLNRKKALKGAAVQRVVFNAITKTAVTEAMKHPRDIDMELVDAYLARRALDYLVGFTLSPVLWRKLPGSRAASCCRVEVVKGGAGERRAGLVSTAETLNCPASTAWRAARAEASLFRSNLESFLPSCLVSRARNGSAPAETSASTVQYSWARKASISTSRSTTSRKATDCTRPAEREPGSLRQSTGERVKPTR